MVKNDTSSFRFYSLGIVAKDKERTSTELIVFPVEDLPLTHGPINDYKLSFSNSLPDSSGATSSSSTEGKATITAKWIPLGGSNRGTAPDCCANETVMIFKYGDNDEYFWTPIFNEPGIRRLETVCFMCGDKKKPLEEWDKESSYWAEISTHDKHIKIHTSRSDEEPYSYDVKIDTKEGYIEMKDDVGNIFKLDSKEGTISLTAIKSINLTAPDVNISNRSTTKGDVKMEAKAAVKGAVTMDDTVGVKGAATLDNTINVKGATTLQSTATVQGVTNMQNGMTVTGPMTMPGMSTTPSGFKIDNSLEVGNGLKAKDIVAETITETNPRPVP